MNSEDAIKAVGLNSIFARTILKLSGCGFFGRACRRSMLTLSADLSGPSLRYLIIKVLGSIPNISASNAR